MSSSSSEIDKAKNKAKWTKIISGVLTVTAVIVVTMITGKPPTNGGA
jgi:predicted AlkP superfamily pyrophosphatase or phosphodiesterase